MRTRLSRLGVLLILAAAVTVLVAWTSAYWVDGLPVQHARPTDEGASHREQPRWDVALHERWGCTLVLRRYRTRAPVPSPLAPSASKDEIDAWFRARQRHEAGLPPLGFDEPAEHVVSLPSWSAAASRPDPRTPRNPGTPRPPGTTHDASEWEDARGWPLRSLLCVYRLDGGAWSVVGGLDLERSQGPLGLPAALPLRPVWIGFVLDSLAYAALAYALFFGPRAVVRWLRGRSLRCPDCGYPAGSSATCSECGGALPTRMQR